MPYGLGSTTVQGSSLGFVKATQPESTSFSGLVYNLDLALAPNEGQSPSLAIGSTFPNMKVGASPLAFSNVAFGAGFRTGGGENGNLGEIETGHDNCAVGAGVLTNLKTGSGNVGMGSDAISACVSGSNNTAVGAQALEEYAGSSNTAVGQAALQKSTGVENDALGAGALTSLTTGTKNTGIGRSALSKVKTGKTNVAVGASAGANTTSEGNVFIGSAAGQGSVEAAYKSNVAIGASALKELSAGASNGNVAVGFEAGKEATTAEGLALVGSESGRQFTGAKFVSTLGFRAGNTDGTTESSAGLENATLVGERAQSTINNVIVLGKGIATRPNLIFGAAPVATHFRSGVGVFHIHNATTKPNAEIPTEGVVLFAEAGKLFGLGASGVIKEIGAL